MKLATTLTFNELVAVAPRAGAWIETVRTLRVSGVSEGRSPCGGVD